MLHELLQDSGNLRPVLLQDFCLNSAGMKSDITDEVVIVLPELVHCPRTRMHDNVFLGHSVGIVYLRYQAVIKHASLPFERVFELVHNTFDEVEAVVIPGTVFG